MTTVRFSDWFTDKYVSRLNPDSSSAPGDGIRNGFANDNNVFGYQSMPKEDVLPFSSSSEPLRALDSRLEASKKSMGSVAALRELVRFHKHPPLPPLPLLTLFIIALIGNSEMSSNAINWFSIFQCTSEGLGLAFQTQPQLSAAPGQKNEIYAQVSKQFTLPLFNC